MKLFAIPFLMFSSAALVGAGCATDEADDVSTSDDALLTCGGVHHNPEHHRGHHHHRHHHGGSGGSAGHLGTGSGGTTGMGGSTGTGGTGGSMVDPRCVVPDGVVSWWHADGDFDDGVGTNDGNNAGAVSFAAGIDQQDFSLTGTLGSYVEVPNDPSLQMTGAVTIDAWVNTSVFGGRIVDKITAFGSDGFLLDMIGDQVRLIVSPDIYMSTDAGSHVPAAIWTHVAGTFDGATLATFMNGVQLGSMTASPHGVPVNANTLRIGADSTGGSLFTGGLDEVRIFNRGLSATEVQTLFWQGTNCP